MVDWRWQMFGWWCHILCYVSDIHTRAYSPSPCRDFVCKVVWGWMINVGYLPHDFDIRSYTRTYFSNFIEYPWDWNSSQLGFRLSASMGLPTIDCIRTSLHGFVEIEMDHIRFHQRCIGGSFNQMLLRYIAFIIDYLANWVIQMSSILVHFEIFFLDESRYTHS